MVPPLCQSHYCTGSIADLKAGAFRCIAKDGLWERQDRSVDPNFTATAFQPDAQAVSDIPEDTVARVGELSGMSGIVGGLNGGSPT